VTQNRNTLRSAFNRSPAAPGVAGLGIDHRGDVLSLQLLDRPIAELLPPVFQYVPAYTLPSRRETEEAD
jgi:hypothetical protein